MKIIECAYTADYFNVDIIYLLEYPIKFRHINERFDEKEFIEKTEQTKVLQIVDI